MELAFGYRWGGEVPLQARHQTQNSCNRRMHAVAPGRHRSMGQRPDAWGAAIFGRVTSNDWATDSTTTVCVRNRSP